MTCVTATEALLFLQNLIDKGLSGSTVGQASTAIGCHFQTADRSDPMAHRLVSALVSTARRLGAPVQHKEPATLDHIKHLQKFALATENFATVWTYIIGLMIYASCSRLDKIIDLPLSSVYACDNFIHLHEWAQWAELRRQFWSPALCGTCTCTRWDCSVEMPHRHPWAISDGKAGEVLIPTKSRLRMAHAVVGLAPSDFEVLSEDVVFNQSWESV